MRNALLYETLKEYCKTALSFLTDKLNETERLPLSIEEKFEIPEPAGSSKSFSKSYVKRYDWLWFIDCNQKCLKQLSAYNAAVRVMEEDKRVSVHLNTLVGTIESRMRVDCDICLRSLLVQVLLAQTNMDFQPNIFDRIYKGIEDYFYQDVMEIRFLCLLEGLEMQTETIELNPNLSIIRIPKEEKEEILSHSMTFLPALSPHKLFFIDNALEFVVETPKVIGGAEADSQELPTKVAAKQFYEVCSALRLFKNGVFGYSNYSMKVKCWLYHGGISFTSIGEETSRGSPYVLSNTDIPLFLRFWQLFQKVRSMNRNRIEIALRRFNFAYGRGSAEDKLIDYLIGFEALLLKKDERQELEYRLVLRGSTLLGKKPDDRKSIFLDLKTAYGKRSDIVHGETIRDFVTIGDEKVQFNKFVIKIEEHLRSAIKEFLVLCEAKSESQVIKALDEKIVGGSDL